MFQSTVWPFRVTLDSVSTVRSSSTIGVWHTSPESGILSNGAGIGRRISQDASIMKTSVSAAKSISPRFHQTTRLANTAPTPQ